jgi:gamma-glutamylputrescine oxidase
MPRTMTSADGREPAGFYEASAGAAARFAPLLGEQSTDVCVIGGGLSGLAAALELRERGYSVVLLESHAIGAGASGRNGGQVGSGQRLDVMDLEQCFGLSQARTLWNMAEEAKAIIARRIEEHAIECHWRAGNLMAITRQSLVADAYRETEYLHHRYDYDRLQMLDMGQMHRRVSSTEYVAGCLDHGGGHLHPLLYVRGLARAAHDAGVDIYEQSPALRLQWGARNTVITPQGVVQAGHVLLCCNGYLDETLEPRIARRIASIVCHQIATESLGAERARALIVDDCCVYSSKRVLDYFRLSHDHRLIFGGGQNYLRVPSGDSAASVRRCMLDVFPQLHDVRIDYTWSGRVCITMDRMPEFGRVGSNGWFVHGFSGHGVALSQLAGRLLAEAVAGSAERFDVFAKMPHRTFPRSAWLRQPLLAAGLMWQLLRDRL